MNIVRIGTRGSPLALTQAEMVRRQLGAADPNLTVELVTIATSGDRVRGALREHGGKFLYVKEIEEALLAGTVDLAVHSMKDLPGELPDGLAIVAVMERDDPRDALVTRGVEGLAALPAGARIGTSSLRRQWQVLSLRPDCAVVPVRGNVGTRVRKLIAGEFDALVMAAAGLKRLGIKEPHITPITTTELLPAIGQGAIVVEGRRSDDELAAFVRLACHHMPTGIATTAERAVLRAVGGDCFTPLAAHAELEGHALRLRGWLATADGTRAVRAERSASIGQDVEAAATLGRAVGEELKVAL
ncbi:MAG: hydroxymethylbilane synthase [Deltaproteobacteria bacterium]|nr:hydroxymethylbilane synthase [Deltaproteobacteria bacterium]